MNAIEIALAKAGRRENRGLLPTLLTAGCFGWFAAFMWLARFWPPFALVGAGPFVALPVLAVAVCAKAYFWPSAELQELWAGKRRVRP